MKPKNYSYTQPNRESLRLAQLDGYRTDYPSHDGGRLVGTNRPHGTISVRLIPRIPKSGPSRTDFSTDDPPTEWPWVLAVIVAFVAIGGVFAAVWP